MNMEIVKKIANFTDFYYRCHIVKEQYPLLTSLSRKRLLRDGTLGVVFMLHHIIEKNHKRIPTNEALKVSPVFLEKIIQQYKKRGFVFYSLDNLYELFVLGRKPDQPFVVFTIDDGYLDNYTNALPVFEKYEVPFAVFVATDFIDKKAILWWDSVEDLILSHEQIYTSDGRRYPCGTFKERWDTFRYLRERILNLDQSRLAEGLNNMFKDYDVDWYAPIRYSGMTWDQIKALANHPLCTIGGHTVSHPALNKLSLEEARMEIMEGKNKIEHIIHQSLYYFAYPFGTPNEIGDRECQLISELGIRLAFMAHKGCINNIDLNNVTHLPRIILKEMK
jgi:peptidoglycan/xylan/chitin deacetylase (PgdA/CDA1 family)